MKQKSDVRLIETDLFPFDFLSQLAARESWRKEIHRPIYHIHKWWATRLGSVFRGILLGAALPEGSDLSTEFYKTHSLSNLTVFDPFMGSGTTIGEAHKLGLTAIGRDINPVAAESVRTALGPLDGAALESTFDELSCGVGEKIRRLYRSKDSTGNVCDVLYFFWVMQVPCIHCGCAVDLFPSWVIASNAYPSRKPEVQILCPSCGFIFPGTHGRKSAICPSCNNHFDPQQGIARGTRATCLSCHKPFTILEVVRSMGSKPTFRLYGKLVLTPDGRKEYLQITSEDKKEYEKCSAQLREESAEGNISLPSLGLSDGHNTRQALSYGFTKWRDFFNDRQLLAISWLYGAIHGIPDMHTRGALLALLSGTLEFNNVFASYKGEGTGAVRHMFSHHILKPERTPIEANVWGTPKSSGSFSSLFRSRLLRAVEYRVRPTEINGIKGMSRLCSPSFSGQIEAGWPNRGGFLPRAIYLSCGDSAHTDLPDACIDLVVTDPPFFDNVHYSELADFFYAWQQLVSLNRHTQPKSTRNDAEVQDTNAEKFATKLERVFRECSRILKDSGLLIFTYHHSKDEGWRSVAAAILGAGFLVVNSHPVKSEMSVATPKSQAKEPIQLDIILVCRKRNNASCPVPRVDGAKKAAEKKLGRLHGAGFSLSLNDQKIVYFGQLLTTLRSPNDASSLAKVESWYTPETHADALVVPQRRLEF